KLKFSDLEEIASNLGEAMLTGNLSASLAFTISTMDLSSPVPPPDDAEWAQPYSVGYYLGYRETELIGTSWYNLLHPHDLSHASAQHYRFLSGGSEVRVEMIVRLQSKDAQWIWVYIVVQVECAEGPVLCSNYTVSESEAWCLRQQLIDEQEESLLYPCSVPAQIPQHQPVQSPSYLSSPDTVFTPMASTPTSGVSTQSFDFSGICGLDFAEVSGPTGGEEDAELFRHGGLLPTLPQEKEETGQRGTQRTGKLPELSYSDCTFGADSPTPPCTPQLLGTTFTFSGQETFGPSELYYPLEPCASLYERLPPSPDSPGHGGCTVMGLPQVPTPLYIHVPSTPEGILTPEASPIKLPANCYFGYLVEGTPRTSIDALVKQLGHQLTESQLAAGGIAQQQEPAVGESCQSLSSSVPTRETTEPDSQASKPWRGIDFSAISLSQDEDAIEDILKDLRASSVPGGGAAAVSPQQLRGGISPSPTAVGNSQAVSDCTPDTGCTTDLSAEEHTFLEELTSYENVFETFASRSPCDGFIDELYQLQSHSHEYFHQDGNGSESSF
ncbi:neuronal PAS domain-containing protein 4-like, partial [Chiloscyllium plagiosum]|uniref:neuronal PAS domain-containing protein 4-like n=1 Tax=Chiloscyllium plagiosum TaxID=36176 RepID=UPI001CB839E8